MLSRARDLELRLLNFAQLVCQSAGRLPRTIVRTHIAAQVLRSGTSAVTTHAEAQSAESRKDFIHKMLVCLKELRETFVWLQLITRLGLDRHQPFEATQAEANELIAIFMASVKTARKNAPKTRT